MSYRQFTPPAKEENVAETQTEAKQEAAIRQATAVFVGSGDGGDANTNPTTLRQKTNGRLSRAGDTLIQLQNQYGNQYVQQLINPQQQLTIQPKLMLGDVDTPSEREADQVAHQVMRGEQTTTPSTVRGTETAVSPQTESAISQAKGGGQPLPDNTRVQMEQSLGSDLSEVRIHTDSRANSLNHSLQATAFTIGQDIFFRQGTYQPRSTTGQNLLAHELTHVLQQTQPSSPPNNQIQRKAETNETPDFQVNKNHPLPGKLGTIAAAQGDQIYLSPLFNNFPVAFQQEVMHHEIGHIKQQHQMPIPATKTINGYPVNQDPSLEKSASLHTPLSNGQFTGDPAQQAIQAFGNIPAWALRYLMSEGVKYGAEYAINHYEELLKQTVDKELEAVLKPILFKLYWSRFGYAAAKMLMPKVALAINETRKKYGYTIDDIIKEHAPTLASWIPRYDLSGLVEIISEIPVNLAANYIRQMIGGMGVSGIQEVTKLLQDPKLQFIQDHAKELDIGYSILTIRKPKLKNDNPFEKTPFQELSKKVQKGKDKVESKKEIITRLDPKKQLYAELAVELLPAFYAAVREAYYKSDGTKSWQDLFEIAGWKFAKEYGDGALKAVTRFAVGQGLDYMGFGPWVKAIVQPMLSKGLLYYGSKYVYSGSKYVYNSLSSWWYGSQEEEIQQNPNLPPLNHFQNLIDNWPPEDLQQFRQEQEFKNVQNELFNIMESFTIDDIAPPDIDLTTTLSKSALVKPKQKKAPKPQKQKVESSSNLPQQQSQNIISSNIVPQKQKILSSKSKVPDHKKSSKEIPVEQMSYRLRARVVTSKTPLYKKPGGSILYMIPRESLVFRTGKTQKTGKSKEKVLWAEVQHSSKKDRYSKQENELVTGWVPANLLREIGVR